MQVDPGLSFEGDGRATKKFANGCGQIGGGGVDLESTRYHAVVTGQATGFNIYADTNL